MEMAKALFSPSASAYLHKTLINLCQKFIVLKADKLSQALTKYPEFNMPIQLPNNFG